MNYLQIAKSEIFHPFRSENADASISRNKKIIAIASSVFSGIAAFSAAAVFSPVLAVVVSLITAGTVFYSLVALFKSRIPKSDETAPASPPSQAVPSDPMPAQEPVDGSDSNRKQEPPSSKAKEFLSSNELLPDETAPTSPPGQAVPSDPMPAKEPVDGSDSNVKQEPPSSKAKEFLSSNELLTEQTLEQCDRLESEAPESFAALQEMPSLTEKTVLFLTQNSAKFEKRAEIVKELQEHDLLKDEYLALLEPKDPALLPRSPKWFAKALCLLKQERLLVPLALKIFSKMKRSGHTDKEWRQFPYFLARALVSLKSSGLLSAPMTHLLLESNQPHELAAVWVLMKESDLLTDENLSLLAKLPPVFEHSNGTRVSRFKQLLISMNSLKIYNRLTQPFFLKLMDPEYNYNNILTDALNSPS